MQSRQRGKRKRRETKLAVVHEGWEERQGNGEKTDYRLVNPTYIPVLDTSREFWEYVR
ncbi:hypothetical protein KKC1_29830, partial [Calderihabitans maritimus]